MIRTTAGTASVLAVVLALTACASTPGAAPTAGTPSPTATVRPTPAVEVPVAPATPPPSRTPTPPVRLVASTVGVDVGVQPVGVEPGGFMQIPDDPAIGGWYRYGSDPSSADGNVVIAAHVDSRVYSIGPFSRLRDLAAGAVVEVTDASGGVHRYAVESVTYIRKRELPVAELFAREGSRNLVLITCGGPIDPTTGLYADNVVAIATPVT
ncbi:UNVERIFIED_CONTAM: class F sortase [Microbacterium sp. SLM126]